MADARALDANRLRAPAFAIATIGFVFAAIRLVGPFDYGYDFAVYRVAGSAVVHHESLFGPWIGQHLDHPLPFTYPPLAAAFAVPFALVVNLVGYALWNIASIAARVLVVGAATTPLVQHFASPRLALAVVCAIALALTPVQDEIGFGQVGIVLMAMCFFDCSQKALRWPRGLLVGAATAIKLVPGVFIPYLWLSGRRRAAMVATATFAVLSLADSALMPADSKSFWTSRVFDNSGVGNTAYVSNQSLNGMLERALGPHVHAVWFVLAGAVAVFGLRRAAVASRRGQELLGLALAALVGVLVSPVSWIHHLGDNIPLGWHLGWIAAVLRDSYGLLCVFLLFALAQLVSVPRPVTEPA
jgi:alpha-1,2-mannosyltransferase